MSTMRIQVAVPEEHIEKPVLDAALESVTRLNEAMLEKGQVPLFSEAVNRVRWQPEPPGQEHFDHAKTVMERGHGDCDDLAPWHAASLRATGQDPDARAIVYQSGPSRWHAVVERSDGEIEDPSAAAGMPTPDGARASQARLMVAGSDAAVVGAYMLRPQIALTPRWGGWQARADLPWNWEEELIEDKPTPTDWAMTSLDTAPVASTALVGAIMGVVALADESGAGDPEHIARLCCLADAAEGWPFEDLEEEYGSDHAAAAVHVVGAMRASLAGAWYNPVDWAKGAYKHVIKPAAKALYQHYVPGQSAAPGGQGAMQAEALRQAQQIPGFSQLQQQLAPMVTMFIPGLGPVLAPAMAAMQFGGGQQQQAYPQQYAQQAYPQQQQYAQQPQYAYPQGYGQQYPAGYGY